MPFGLHNKHSNRSKQALNDPAQGQAQAQGQGGATPPSGNSVDNFSPSAQAFNQQSPLEAQQYSSQGTADIDRRSYQSPGDFPSRSHSTRHKSQAQFGGSADDLVLDTPKVQQQAPVKSKNFFDRMRSSREPKTTAENTSGLARRLSRRQESPPVVARKSLEQQQRLEWQAAQGSRTHLPSPQEANEDDNGLDPYLIQPGQEPSHNSPLEQSQQQTIRTVPSDSDQAHYGTNDDEGQQFQTQQQLGHSQVIHQPSDSGSPNHYHLHHQSNSQQHLNLQPGSLIISDPYRQENPETVSQLSYEDQRPISVQSNGQSPTAYNLQRQDYPNRTTSIQTSRPLSQYTGMAPPAGASQQNRRPADPKQTMPGAQGQQEARDGPPPNYSRQQFPGNQPPTPGLPTGSQGPNYRGGPPQREQYGPAGGGEQGRNTPPPAPADRDVNDAYKELLTKYKKVKGLYFDKTAQVEQLQNTLANQRLSQSRTSLDDSEYMTRFQRLDGATTNLAFNIRKDWRTVPAWLSQYVNQDAIKIGKQEMTAVGRAFITKFLVDEIFSRSFHPGLESDLSCSLKIIELNIRRFSPALNNQEESDALISKVVNWRLATLEGLKDILTSTESEECKKQFSQMATTNLTAKLINFLQEPIPAGIEDSAHMIIELAVSIASNLPLESRDINIMYPMPGDPVQPFTMKVETGIPPLENPGAETPTDADASSTNSGEKEDSSKDSDKESKRLAKEKPKREGSMLSAVMGVGSSSGSGTKKGGPQAGEASGEGKAKISAEDGPQKVRFAGFVGIEVRGRQILSKAPVWAVF